jgi:hypothetical protein
MAAAEAEHLTSFVQLSSFVQDAFEEDCRYWPRVVEGGLPDEANSDADYGEITETTRRWK